MRPEGAPPQPRETEAPMFGLHATCLFVWLLICFLYNILSDKPVIVSTVLSRVLSQSGESFRWECENLLNAQLVGQK